MTVVEALGNSAPSVIGWMIVSLLGVVGTLFLFIVGLFLRDMRKNAEFRHQTFVAFHQTVMNSFQLLNFRCDTLDESNKRIEKDAGRLDSKVEVVCSKVDEIGNKLASLQPPRSGQPPTW